MKKKLLKIVALAMLISMFTIQGVYAAGDLTVEKMYPEDGETGLQTTNQMARIVFSGDIDVAQNEDYFHVLDKDGKAQEIMVLEQSDDPNRVNLILVGALQENSEYTIVIDGAVADKDGNTLGKEIKTTFKTRSMKTDSIITTVMMVLMFVAIIVFTVRDTAKKQREAEEENRNGKKKPEKVNPYKEAKKEAEKIRANKKKEKERQIQQQMAKNKKKAEAKKKK